MDREAWQDTVHGVASQMWLSVHAWAKCTVTESPRSIIVIITFTILFDGPRHWLGVSGFGGCVSGPLIPESSFVGRDSGLPLEMGPFLLALQKSPDVQALSVEALPAVESFPSKKWFWPSPGLELKHFWQKWFPGNWADSVPLLLRMRCFCGRTDG